MSALVDDSTSTRFTSLVRELGDNPNQPHLIWQTGRVETTVVGPSHPKYASWNNRFFVVNPVTNTYESVNGYVVKSHFYCQYLGENLALLKTTYPSSNHHIHNRDFAVVDGIIDMIFWHADSNSPIEKHWFAVDLGREFLVTSILLLGRRNCCGERSRFMKVWIGNVAPPVEQPLDITLYQLCGEYPYIQGTGYLSGIFCENRVRGQIVILENGHQPTLDTVLQISELLIF